MAIALKVLGRGFGVKTIYAIFIASLFFEILPGMIPEAFIQEIAVANGKLLCAIFGGACAGLGIGITFSQGGSTGGTDIIALMINKYRNISPGRVILLIDIFIIASSLLLKQEGLSIGQRLATVLYGYILIGVCSYTVDLVISGTKQSLQVFIFSKEYEGIADKITQEIGRGVTVINGQGWFTKQDGKILLTIVRKTELSIIYKMVKECDKSAFLSVGSVMGVYGEGFEQIKK